MIVPLALDELVWFVAEWWSAEFEALLPNEIEYETEFVSKSMKEDQRGDLGPIPKIPYEPPL